MLATKPCPFCGCNTVILYDDGTEQTAQCMKCKAQGPWKELGDNAALIAWNARAEDRNP